jgi:hypothetical protein
LLKGVSDRVAFLRLELEGVLSRNDIVNRAITERLTAEGIMGDVTGGCKLP